MSFVQVATATRLAPGNYGRISRLAGLSKQHVSRVLRGERNCSLPVGARIAAAAKVSLDQLYRFIVGLDTHIPGRPTRRQLRAALKVPRFQKVKPNITRRSTHVAIRRLKELPVIQVAPRVPRNEYPHALKKQLERLGVPDPVESPVERIRREMREQAAKSKVNS